MAKRKSRRANGVPVRIPLVEHDDSGIYRREKVVGEKHETWTQEQAIACLQSAGDYAGQLENDFARIVAAAADIVRPHVNRWNGKAESIEAGRTGCNLNLGDGGKPCTIPTQLPDEVREAVEALRFVKELRGVAAREGADHFSFHNAMRLGRLVERLHVRPFEPLVVIGKKNKAGRDSSSAVRRQDAKAKAVDWQHRADEIWNRNPTMEIRKVARAVANQYQPVDRPKVETIRKAIKQTGTKKLRR